jgi:putative FmdB family regulatory protein
MPLYEYVCSTCGQSFEKELPFSTQNSNIRCPSGHRKVHRVYSAPLIMFKGSGFYSTDNRSNPFTSDRKS